jgi:methyl-accepting chemotaxis protein
MNNLEAFIHSIPYIKELMQDDMMITVFDHEKYVYYAPSAELNFHHKPGDPLPPAYLNYAMVDATKTVVVKVPAEEFGVAFDSISMAVKDDRGQVIGAINAAVSTTKKDTLDQIIQTVDQLSNAMFDKIQVIASHTEQLSGTIGQVSNQADKTQEYSAKIKDVSGTIKGISDQTNLLGLNAAIEAARVGGAAGAGFGVVADEIRKLSRSSKEATVDIEQILKNITDSLSIMQNDYRQIASSSNEEARLIKEFLYDVEKLQQTSEKIKQYLHSSLLTNK